MRADLLNRFRNDFLTEITLSFRLCIIINTIIKCRRAKWGHSRKLKHYASTLAVRKMHSELTYKEIFGA